MFILVASLGAGSDLHAQMVVAPQSPAAEATNDEPSRSETDPPVVPTANTNDAPQVSDPDVSPATASDLQAGAESGAPPVSGSDAPPVAENAAPPGDESVTLPVTESGAPPVVESEAPPAVESEAPPVVDSSPPPAVESDLSADAVQPGDVAAASDEPDADVATVDADEDGEDAGASAVAPSAPVAEDVDLSKPVIMPEKTPVETPEPGIKPSEPAGETPSADVKPPLVLLGEEVAPATSARLSWSPDQHFDGIAVPTPVLVVNGVKPGKTLCLTAAVHGDELNGIEIVRRVLYDLDPQELSGAVIGVPIVNLQGFRRSSRYLPDRRDLNRFFPGSARGSSASRIAHSFFTEVIGACDALVDIHTGSFLRANLPQLRANMKVPEVAALTEGFGATAVLHRPAARGTLRWAAVAAGIPAVTLEAGEPSRLQEKEIKHGTKGVQTLLTKLDLTRRVRVWGEPEPVYYQSVWIRADHGGLLFGQVKLGQRVREDQLLGTITDPITNVRTELRAPMKGRILGMALNQVVLPGFAAFRIGIPTTEADVAQPDAIEAETPAVGGSPAPADTVDEDESDDENS